MVGSTHFKVGISITRSSQICTCIINIREAADEVQVKWKENICFSITLIDAVVYLTGNMLYGKGHINVTGSSKLQKSSQK